MYKYLGIDCANKSLAYSSVTITAMAEIVKAIRVELVNFANSNFDDAWDVIKGVSKCSPEFPTMYAERALKHPHQLLDMLKKLSSILATRINLEVGGVIDLMPGRKVKDVDIVERTKLLRKALDTVPSGEDKLTILEDQPPVLNYKSSTVQDQAMMYFSKGEVAIVNPTLKNKLYFHDTLKHEVFIPKYAKRYDANKAHTEANLLYYLKVFGLEHMTHGIKKCNYPDFADSFMETIAYHLANVKE